jgi:hypothetical protein
VCRVPYRRICVAAVRVCILTAGPLIYILQSETRRMCHKYVTLIDTEGFRLVQILAEWEASMGEVSNGYKIVV